MSIFETIMRKLDLPENWVFTRTELCMQSYDMEALFVRCDGSLVKVDSGQSDIVDRILDFDSRHPLEN